MWCLGLKTWKALPLPLAPGLLREEEKGRMEDGVEGEERGDAIGRNPTIPAVPSEPPGMGEPISTGCVWGAQLAKAGCGDTTATDITGPGGVVSTPPATMPLTSAILTGERIAFGRGRLLELLTVETICTGPPPPFLLPWR